MNQFPLRARRLLALALTALIALPQAGFAQAPAKPAAAKPAAEKSVMQEIQLLFVQNSTGMSTTRRRARCG